MKPRVNCSVLLRTIFVLEDVEDRQDLSVVRHQSLAYHLGRDDEMLQHLERDAHHHRVPCAQRICNKQL